MNDDRVFSKFDNKCGEADCDNLEVPVEWRYDTATGKLHMLFNKDGATRLICSSAMLGRDKGSYRIATLASSQEVLLWHSNYSKKLNATLKPA